MPTEIVAPAWVFLLIGIVGMVMAVLAVRDYRNYFIKGGKYYKSPESAFDRAAVVWNERIFRNPRLLLISREEAEKLIPHPTIKCTFSQPYWHEKYRHPLDAMAVHRENMHYPLCARCWVETPYE